MGTGGKIEDLATSGAGADLSMELICTLQLGWSKLFLAQGGHHWGFTLMEGGVFQGSCSASTLSLQVLGNAVVPLWVTAIPWWLQGILGYRHPFILAQETPNNASSPQVTCNFIRPVLSHFFLFSPSFSGAIEVHWFSDLSVALEKVLAMGRKSRLVKNKLVEN
jgi:hypothetical protein